MSPNRATLRIGYVLKRFPRFSETFILNELLGLESLGTRLDVFSLLRPPEEARHANLSMLKAPVITLAALGRVLKIGLQSGLEQETKEIAALLPGTVSEALFSGKSGMEIAALHFKAAMVALRANARGITHLHAHFMSDASTVALLAARMMGGTYSFTAHARDIYHTYVNPASDAEMRRAKIASAAFVVTVSDYNANHLRKLCPNASNRIHRLYNGVDLAAFAVAPRRSRAPGRIIAVGRLVEKKGFPDLVDACALLRERSVPFECQIIGEGPMAGLLTEKVRALNLDPQIAFTGSQPQEQLVQTLGTATVATLPCIVSESGDRDGLPTVLLEAMARGLPVVTTTVSGGPEIVENGKTGWLCPPGEPAALADALQSVLANSDGAYQMGQAGRRRAESLFDLRRNVATLADLFATTQPPGRAEGQAA